VIKIDIISGFLGAGKTTLINKLVAEAYPGERVALLENEFGEIGIDGDLAAASGITVKELANGCICCTLQGDFVEGITELAGTVAPDRIVIEPTGLARLGDILNLCSEAGKKLPLKINAVITVVNALSFPALISVCGELFSSQIADAQFIALSAVQDIPSDETDLGEVIEGIRALNPTAPLLSDPWDTLDALRMLAAAEEAARDSQVEHHHEGHEHHHHHDTDDWESISLFVTAVWTKDSLRDLAEKLKKGDFGKVYRSKGLLPCGVMGKAIKFDYVYGNTDITAIDYSGKGKLVIIGRSLKKDILTLLGDI
jgi:G3E family GTPase